MRIGFPPSALAQTCGPQTPNTANTIKNNIFAFFNHAAKQEGCIPPGNGILQFNYTNNLVYYEPKSSVQASCVYSRDGSLSATQNYRENMYCYAGECQLFYAHERIFHLQFLLSEPHFMTFSRLAGTRRG